MIILRVNNNQNDHIKWLEDNEDFGEFITNTQEYFKTGDFIRENMNYFSSENKTKLEILLKRFEYYQTNGIGVLQSLYQNIKSGGSNETGLNVLDDDNTGITPIVVTSQQDFGYFGSGIEDFIDRFNNYKR